MAHLPLLLRLALVLVRVVLVLQLMRVLLVRLVLQLVLMLAVLLQLLEVLLQAGELRLADQLLLQRLHQLRRQPPTCVTGEACTEPLGEALGYTGSHTGPHDQAPLPVMQAGSSKVLGSSFEKQASGVTPTRRTTPPPGPHLLCIWH